MFDRKRVGEDKDEKKKQQLEESNKYMKTVSQYTSTEC